MTAPLDIVILGLSITSSWGNGHATTYRALVRALCERGHRVTFLERDVPWYRANRDLPKPPYGTTRLYRSQAELRRRYAGAVARADLVVIGSFVPDGAAVAGWLAGTCRGILAFYDIDTPVTLAKLARREHDYISPALIPRFDLYLSFTGGPVLKRLERIYGARRARALYCSVDPSLYHPERRRPVWDLGYMGTFSEDRQPTLEKLLCTPARQWADGRFVVAGPQYPTSIVWPTNVKRIEHLPPGRHRRFYANQRFTLNVTRADMVRAGWSPSVRLFEAAACGTPLISDRWAGLETLFVPGEEIVIADGPAETLAAIRGMNEETRRSLGERARRRILAAHTAACRAAELESYVAECREAPRNKVPDWRRRSAAAELRRVSLAGS